MNIYTAVETAISNDTAHGFIKGATEREPGKSCLGVLQMAARYVALEAIANVLGMDSVLLYAQYHEQKLAHDVLEAHGSE